MKVESLSIIELRQIIDNMPYGATLYNQICKVYIKNAFSEGCMDHYSEWVDGMRWEDCASNNKEFINNCFQISHIELELEFRKLS